MAKVRDIDNGYKALLKKIKEAKKASITVGVHQKEGDASHEKGSLSVLDVGTFHEFGLGVPERSFIRGWFDENQKWCNTFISGMLRSVVEGKREFSQTLEQIGLKFVGSVQERISNRIPPPLAASTIKAKGSDVPLIDTGQLRTSITYKVETDAGTE
jgi:hypothetical protein